MANLQTTCITGFLNVCQSTASPSVAGRLWYDNSSCTLKYSYCGTLSTWTTTGNFPNSIGFLRWGTGTQNAALSQGGQGNSGVTSETYEYNGNTWATVGGYNIAYRVQGAGTQNAGLAFGGSWPGGGYSVTNTKEYNGNTWSSGGFMVESATNHIGQGTQNAAFTTQGESFTTLYISNVVCRTQEYNGNTWSSAGNYPINNSRGGATGTQTAGLGAGGQCCSNVYEYNGNTWASGGTLLSATDNAYGFGTQNATIHMGNTSSPFAYGDIVQEYNGNTWSYTTCRILGTGDGGGAGTSTAGVAFAGYKPNTYRCNTEEYNSSTGVQVCEL